MDEETAQFDVACHVAGCENDGITLRVLATASAPLVTCGPCSTVTTDIVQIVL